MDWERSILYKYFAEYFGSFNAEHLKQISSNICQELRNLLSAHGVYVSKGRDVLISDALFADLGREIPWPHYDEDALDRTN